MESLLNQYRRQPGQLGLGDVDGEFHVKQMLRGCIPNPRIDRALGISGAYVILLYGEAGSGKGTLTEALSCEIAKTGCDFFFAQMPAWALMGDSDREICGYIRRLFEELHGQADSVLVVIEDIAPICRQPAAAWMLSECIDHLLMQEISCTVVLTINDMKLVPECLLKVVVPCKVEKPDLEARKKYFKRTLPETIRCEYGLTPNVMAQMTYGFGYSQLRQCVRMILLQIKHEMTVLGGAKNLTRQGFEALAQNLRQAGSDARTASVTLPVISSAADVRQTASAGTEIEKAYDIQAASENTDSERSSGIYREELPDLDHLPEALPDLDDLPDELEEWEV